MKPKGLVGRLSSQDPVNNCAVQFYSICFLNVVPISMSSYGAKLQQLSNVIRDTIQSQILAIAEIPENFALQDKYRHH
jgi:hypothetical protein